MRRKLSASFIETAKPGPKRIEVHDTEVTGLSLMVTPLGSKSFPVRGRIRGGDGRSHKLATLPIALGLKKARKEARKILEIAAEGKVPREERKREAAAKAERGANTFAAVVRRFIASEAGRGLRSFDQMRYVLERHALPRIGDRPIAGIRKSEITRLYDEVVAGHGRRTAERTAQQVVAVFNWHARQADDFVNPIPRGHIKTQSRARHRVLSDAEIRALWAATEPIPGRHEPYRPLVRLLLMTGRRRSELAGMTWSELGPEGHLLPAQRNKTGLPLLCPLAPSARFIIEAQPRLGALVFTHDGHRQISDWSHLKTALNRRMLAALRESDPQAALEPFALHDLRRSCRTILSRLRVPGDAAEACLGHVIGGVKGVYDRHDFLDEKSEAYAKLSVEIARIVGFSVAVEPPIMQRSRDSKPDPPAATEVTTPWGIVHAA